MVSAMMYVPLFGRTGQTGLAIVDDADFPLVSAYRWHLTHYGYAASIKAGRMHRFILGLTPTDPGVDHINRNKLDNRRSNLRLLAQHENLQNQSPRVGTSRYRGVAWHVAAQKWTAQCQVGKKRAYLGLFDTEEAAADAAAAWRRQHMPHSTD